MNQNAKPPSRTADQFVVRFPDGMREAIAKAAKRNNRSMNAEIINRLALSLDEDDINEEPDLPARVLPPGAEIDHGVQVWAQRLLKPGNKHELEALLATIRAMTKHAE